MLRRFLQHDLQQFHGRLHALTTQSAEAVDFHFTSPTKPAILRGHASDDQGLRYALMPVRLTD
ncbi:hypothetical protein ACFUTV_40765 [Streptomyces sp. NPDC057298]|uniref:hypothetical protein n=1 Tax=Streptomyces sp. NPDC057298 TaxID=3346091 RepID=UPI003633396B